jgi:hypothetical protein
MLQRIVSFALITTLLFLPHRIRACEPRPDYWFTEIYNISDILLPENIVIKLSPRPSTRGYLQIYNDSEIPLYILPQDARAIIMVTEEPALAEDGLTEENKPETILLIDQVPELAIYTVTSQAPLYLDTKNLPTLVPYIEDRNITDFNRPGFISLPITQRGEFHLVYGKQIFSIQFSISYALNGNFNPEDCGKGIESTTQQETSFAKNQNSLISNTIVVSLIFLLTLGAILRLQKNGKTRK